MAGFPFRDESHNSQIGSPSVADVDGDGDFELAFINEGYRVINLWNFSSPFYPDKVEWGTMHHDIRNTNLYEQPVAGTLQQNTTWWGRIKVYGNVTVPSGKTLNIQGGTIVHFASGAVLNVNGNINVTGTPYEPVVFDSNSNVNFSSGANVTISPGVTVTVQGTLSIIASNVIITGGGSIVTSGSGKIFVTTNSASALAANNSRKLARDGNGNYHLVFETDGEICYEKLTNDGTAISEFRRISKGNDNNQYPCIAERSGNLYAVWQRFDGTYYDVYFCKSTDGGATWAEAEQIAANFSNSQMLPVIISPATDKLTGIFDGDTSLRYKLSEDDGDTWTGGSVPSTGANANSPTLAATTTYWSSSRSALVYVGGSGTTWNIWYDYYMNGPDSTGWSSARKKLSEIVPGSYTGHKNPSLAPSGTAGNTTLHVIWEATYAASQYRLIHRKATDWYTWPNVYSIIYSVYEQLRQPNITGLSGGYAHLVYQDMINQNEIDIYKINYDGGWGGALFVSTGTNPSVSVGHTTAKYVWTQGSAAPYQIKTSSETLSKTGSGPLAVAYHRSTAILDTTIGAWLEVRLDNLTVKTNSGDEFSIPFEEAKEDSLTLAPAKAFINLASAPAFLPANAESLFVQYIISGQGLSLIKNLSSPIGIEIIFSGKTGGTIGLPVLTITTEGLPETKRLLSARIANLAGKEVSLRTQVSGITQNSSLIASLGHVYEIVEAPLPKRLDKATETVTPQDFTLRVYPNPFNPSTQIHFTMPVEGMARLRIYNLHGQLVRELLHEHRVAGEHSVPWDGRDDRGLAAASGVYFIHAEAGNIVKASKGILIR